jgi:hypothetical protein
MRGAAALGLCCAVAAAVGGCRATPQAPGDDLGVDLAVAGDDFGGDDLATADLAMCPVGPEVCGNGCDDDGNGYTDDDDPACTTQMLVTLSMGSPALWRLILEPTPHVAVLDGNPVISNGGMATYNAAFAPAAFVAFDSDTKLFDRVPIGGGTITQTATSYSMRDVCVFNGELIVLDQKPAPPGFLHRFKPDGVTEIMPTVSVPLMPTACSSDGNMLYVAGHPQIGDSVIEVFGKSANGPVDTGTAIAMPAVLLSAGYTRIVDLVYVKKSGTFVGLFAVNTGNDFALNGSVMAPFAFDGGVGAFIDGGIWHGVGEFLP